MSTTQRTVIPRADYMSNKVSHQEYYRQFVTPFVMDLVKSRIGIDRIRASKDPNLNDIPLKMWDDMHPIVSPNRLQEAGDGLSLSSTVCIAKQAAKMLLEQS